MAQKKKGVAGGKVTQTHQTCIDAATTVVVAAKKCATVKRVVFGQIRQGGSPNSRSIKFKPLQGGFQMTIKGAKSVQDFVVYLTDQEKTQEVQDELLRVFS